MTADTIEQMSQELEDLEKQVVHWRSLALKVSALVQQERKAHAQALADLRNSCAATVFCTCIEACDEDSDDLGLSGWLDVAEQRIREGK